MTNHNRNAIETLQPSVNESLSKLEGQLAPLFGQLTATHSHVNKLHDLIRPYKSDEDRDWPDALKRIIDEWVILKDKFS